MCEQKQKTNDKLKNAVDATNTKAITTSVYTTVGEQEIYHYPKTSMLDWKVAPDSNQQL